MNANATPYTVRFYLNFPDDDSIIKNVNAVSDSVVKSFAHWLEIDIQHIIPAVSYRHARVTLDLPVPQDKLAGLEAKIKDVIDKLPVNALKGCELGVAGQELVKFI